MRREDSATPRYILTGAPGAGKTAVLRDLETRGFAVVEEAATDVIALQQARGHAEPWDAPSFIEQVVTLQQHRQTRTPDTDQPTLFDRSPICTLALCSYLGYPIPSVLAAELERIARDSVYEPTVFLVRNQGFVRPTPARRISFKDSLAFEQLHERTYRKLGFHIEDVPAGPLIDRATHIQRSIDRQRTGAEPD